LSSFWDGFEKIAEEKKRRSVVPYVAAGAAGLAGLGALAYSKSRLHYHGAKPPGAGAKQTILNKVHGAVSGFDAEPVRKTHAFQSGSYWPGSPEVSAHRNQGWGPGHGADMHPTGRPDLMGERTKDFTHRPKELAGEWEHYASRDLPPGAVDKYDRGGRLKTKAVFGQKPSQAARDRVAKGQADVHPSILEMKRRGGY